MDGSSNRTTTPEAGSGSPAAPVVIKKYANRRLYNTATSSYVTLDYLAQMVKDRVDFVVYDARSGDDITRSVLAQIIFDEENKGKANLLPIPFLRQLISFYGDSLQGMVPQYLELSMQQFARNQEQMRGYMRNALGFDFLQRIEDMNRQNMAMFEQAMKVFNPFAALSGQHGTPGSQPPQAPPAPPAPAAAGADPGPALDELRRKLEELNKQVAEITRNRG